MLSNEKTAWGGKLILTGIVLATVSFLATLLMAEPTPNRLVQLDAPPPQLIREISIPAQSKSLLPGRFQVSLQKGESLAGLFTRLQLKEEDLVGLLLALPAAEQNRLRRLQIGTKIHIGLDEQDGLAELVIMNDSINGVRYYKSADGDFKTADYMAEYHVEHKYQGGSISNSLYQDGVAAGMSGRLILNFAEIFAYDIDFANDVRPNDSFSMLLGELYVENRSTGQQNIDIAEFNNKGKSILAVRYENSAGEVGYYTPSGESMRSRFLRMPISLARVSSHFNPKRRHPVLKIVRPHRGVDFAARRGTPIFTTGNGRISFIGRKGGYGKTIVVSHGDGYSTLYAHLNGYARGMKKNTSVKQGQVIGYVGTTGVSTGPHLHYEFRIKGRHHDPLKVKLARNAKLSKKELPNFLSYSKPILDKYYERRDGTSALAAKN